MAKKKETIERDAHDGGVPMLPASAPRSEATGPEDALGLGPKRGDYTGRLAGSENAHTVVEVVEEHDDGSVETKQVMVPQAEMASEIGEEEGLKGGVDTHSDRAAAEKAGLQPTKPSSEANKDQGS